MPRGIPSRRQISKCSRVCGLMDSLAAIDQQHQIDAANSGEHVPDETLMAGNIDETQSAFSVRREFEVREAEIDGDPAAFFLFQTVGIDAGQGFHQGGFSVIDVPGGADDDGLHCFSVATAPKPLESYVPALLTLALVRSGLGACSASPLTSQLLSLRSKTAKEFLTSIPCRALVAALGA